MNVSIGDVAFSNDGPLALIAGPCVVESRDHAMEMAAALKEITSLLGIGLVYKSSFDKANRTSSKSPRGIGMRWACEIFEEIEHGLGVPVITDVHEPMQCGPIARHVSALQIPAFLCRQTDLLHYAAIQWKPVNVKKGQFLAPSDMVNVARKLEDFGNSQILLTERGASFGYNTLVSDMRSLPIMARTGYPVIFDATHSVQEPGGLGDKSGGRREFVSVLARSAVAAGCAGVFIEVHQDPDAAPSDGPNMLALRDLAPLLTDLMAIDHVVKQ